MDSSLMDSQGNLRSRGALGKETVQMAQTHFQTRGQWVASDDPESANRNHCQR